jgi:hypothetical protein
MTEQIVWTDSVLLEPDHGLRSCRARSKMHIWQCYCACGWIMIGSNHMQRISAANAPEAVRKKKENGVHHFLHSQAAGGAQDDKNVSNCWAAILARTSRLALSGSHARATRQRARHRTQRARQWVSLCDVCTDAPLMTIVVLRRPVNRY